MADPGWNSGHYYGKSFPVMGMHHARELATISYRSGPEWEERFNNRRAAPDKMPDFCPDFLIETYLDKQVMINMLSVSCSFRYDFTNRGKNLAHVTIQILFFTFQKLVKIS